MRILLIYPGLTSDEQPLNIMYISAALKDAGHEVEFLGLTSTYRLRLVGSYSAFKKAFVKRIVSFRPRLIGISVMTVNYKLSVDLSTLAKRVYPKAKILWGGHSSHGGA